MYLISQEKKTNFEKILIWPLEKNRPHSGQEFNLNLTLVEKESCCLCLLTLNENSDVQIFKWKSVRESTVTFNFSSKHSSLCILVFRNSYFCQSTERCWSSVLPNIWGVIDKVEPQCISDDSRSQETKWNISYNSCQGAKRYIFL
jgi:hypothetical protein